MFDIIHIANLARIKLTKEEEKKFRKDLSSILDFVIKLKEVDTKKVKPMSHAAGLENVIREDKQKSKVKSQKSKVLLELAPEAKNGYVKVGKIL